MLCIDVLDALNVEGVFVMLEAFDRLEMLVSVVYGKKDMSNQRKCLCR